MMLLAAFVILVCGLAALVYFISARRSSHQPELERDGDLERDRNQGVLRDEPPPW